MITIGVDLDRYWATILIVVTAIAMFLSAWPMPDWPTLFAGWPIYLRNGLIRAILGVYLGMTSYLLARSLAYQTNTMRKVLGNLLNATIADRWLNTADAVATVIANLLTEAHNAITMNVLIYESGHEQMHLVGSSTAPGQALVEDGFAFQAAQGISGWAAQRGEPCFINNTTHDPETRFLATPAFPGTRSALAMPLQLDPDHSVVLEIESTVPFDVAHEDLQLLSHAGHYLVNAHQRSTMLLFHQQLVRLGTTLADRIIHVNEIGTMLQEIGTVALDLLEADLIRIYYRNPESDGIDQRCTISRGSNTPSTPLNMASDNRDTSDDRDNGIETFAETITEGAPYPLVAELTDGARLRLFPSAQEDPLLLNTNKQENGGIPATQPFVIREDIQSCAAMPLIVGQEKLGLMWINYRRPQPFSPLLQAAIQLLAPYAALAIKSGIQTALTERQRRAAIRRIAHDSLAHRLHDVMRGLERLDNYTPDSVRWNEERLIVQRQVERARGVVNNLINERHWLTLQSVIDDLQIHAQLIEKYYKIAVDATFGPMPKTNISVAGGNELMYACDEILGNIVRHSQATELSVKAKIEAWQLHICFVDNGIGFDTNDMCLGQGIASIKDRIQRMNGIVEIRSEPQMGTSAYLKVPLDEQKGTSDDERGNANE